MRSSGILMPLFSLPSEYGIGSLGKEAYNFIDFLAEAGQTYWQMLPSGPTSYGDSPYQCFSAFASNPYFIDLEELAEDGLLTEAELETERNQNTPGTIDYERLYNTRFALLRKATDRIKAESSRGEKIQKYRRGFGQFVSENSFWLSDYALFMAIKRENNDASFKEWPCDLRYRDEKALAEAKERLMTEIYFWSMIQYIYFAQHCRLKTYANSKGIKLIGDIPIYVSPDSAELWAQQELFLVDELGNQAVQAGCPPDAFSETGQLWGNPIYDWKENANSGYKWWISRLRYGYKLFDIIRIDHFRGFAGYYTIPADKKDAKTGKWEKGPGADFINAIKQAVPQAQTEIIAEDLGLLTPDVHELLGVSGFPGMKVLQFAFDSGDGNIYLPHRYEEKSVVYTGTHDNTTTLDWVLTAPDGTLAYTINYLKGFLRDYFNEHPGEGAMLPEISIVREKAERKNTLEAGAEKADAAAKKEEAGAEKADAETAEAEKADAKAEKTAAENCSASEPEDIYEERVRVTQTAETAEALARALIIAAFASRADTAIIPLQDWLTLGKEARINTPGVLGGNWQWRLGAAIYSQESLLTKQLAARIRDITKKYNR